MDFKFDVNKLFVKELNKITHTLIPTDFTSNPQELRGLGSILGFLKTGWKNLFLFDEAGLYHKLRTKCVLDFYVHESKQRMGLGKILYQHMLEEEHLQPEKLAIDRPSNKFLQFLQKHYGVHGIITQNNKFVVFKGFFDNVTRPTNEVQSMRVGEFVFSGSSQKHSNSTDEHLLPRKHAISYPATSRSSYGRYAAAKPTCSVANIIHDVPTLGLINEPTGSKN
ncbi:alpha-tubulin N-acetyltransferase-like isoform X2 [Aphidius gifuensis]|uniref:alpha-tubulin N-acetyltransferase-like isoform X2 n=1 Tax=Aphidius gifuensis TaxID=684658 RepID=UPI001CDCD5B3|nr:alpha-tubulin N-acetyltransferase-like isoform X2 [Aphidius gifuensis]